MWKKSHLLSKEGEKAVTMQSRCTGCRNSTVFIYLFIYLFISNIYSEMPI